MKIKGHRRTLEALLLGFILNSLLSGQTWKALPFSDEGISYYYDPASIRKIQAPENPSAFIFSYTDPRYQAEQPATLIAMKTVYPKKQPFSDPSCDFPIAFTITQFKIVCRSGSLDSYQITHYGTKGGQKKTIKSNSIDFTFPNFQAPPINGSAEEVLVKRACEKTQ